MIDIITEVTKQTVKKFSDNIPEFGKDKNDSTNTPDFARDMERGLIRDDVDTESENTKIQEKSKYSDDVNEYITTEDELDIYLKADLKETTVGDKPALVRDDIDLEQVDENTGQTNQERMENGKPPLDKNGNPIELHHVGQKADSPLAELTKDEHRGKGNDGVLHDKTQDSEIDRKEFEKEKAEHWKARAAEIKQGE